MADFDHWGKVNTGARSFAPLLVALFLSIVSMIPLKLSFLGAIVPPIGLMAVFYWAVYRPEAFGPVAAAALGLLHDIFSGAPLGFNTALCLLTYGTVASQRQLFLAHSFVVLWWGYAFLVFLVAIISWLLFSVMHSTILPFEPALFQALAGIAFFPVASTIFHWVHRAFLGGS